MKANILIGIAIMMGSVFTISAQQQKASVRVVDQQVREMKRLDRPDRQAGEMQRPARQDHFGFLQKLDDSQREELKKMQLEQMKERTRIHHQLKEKRAKLELLQTADKPDMKEINKTIDEITVIQAQKMKMEAANRQKVRSMLTEEQRVYFDARSAQGDRMREPQMKRPSGGNDRERFRGNGDRSMPPRFRGKDTIGKQ